MKRKILSILALLLFVSGAWAQSTITVYATNAAGWSKMSIHYWGDGENAHGMNKSLQNETVEEAW